MINNLLTDVICKREMIRLNPDKTWQDKESAGFSFSGSGDVYKTN